MKVRHLLPLAALLGVAAPLLFGAATLTHADTPTQYKVAIPMVARDEGLAAPTPGGGGGGSTLTPPPPGPGYCKPSELSVRPPPDGRIAGSLTVNGSAAPAGTLVAITFDGKPGQYAYTSEAGSYRIDYYIGTSAGCINSGTAVVGVSVGGVNKSTGATVTTTTSAIFYAFNVSTP